MKQIAARFCEAKAGLRSQIGVSEAQIIALSSYIRRPVDMAEGDVSGQFIADAAKLYAKEISLDYNDPQLLKLIDEFVRCYVAVRSAVLKNIYSRSNVNKSPSTSK